MIIVAKNSSLVWSAIISFNNSFLNFILILPVISFSLYARQKMRFKYIQIVQNNIWKKRCSPLVIYTISTKKHRLIFTASVRSSICFPYKLKVHLTRLKFQNCTYSKITKKWCEESFVYDYFLSSYFEPLNTSNPNFEVL